MDRAIFFFFILFYLFFAGGRGFVRASYREDRLLNHLENLRQIFIEAIILKLVSTDLKTCWTVRNKITVSKSRGGALVGSSVTVESEGFWFKLHLALD